MVGRTVSWLSVLFVMVVAPAVGIVLAPNASVLPQGSETTVFRFTLNEGACSSTGARPSTFSGMVGDTPGDTPLHGSLLGFTENLEEGTDGNQGTLSADETFGGNGFLLQTTLTSRSPGELLGFVITGHVDSATVKARADGVLPNASHPREVMQVRGTVGTDKMSGVVNVDQRTSSTVTCTAFVAISG